MSTLSRIISSIRDGSFPFKILNRILPKQYVLSADWAIDCFLQDHFPGDEWRSFSKEAKNVWVQLSPVFRRFKIRTVAYVGANVGETALAMNEAFPGVTYFLIEPVPLVFQKLCKRTMGYPNMYCIHTAAGSHDLCCNMNVDEFSAASSLLPYKSMALEEFPFLGKQATVEIKIRPLDRILGDFDVQEIDLLLMDVQGYEDKVLFGAERTLKSCRVVISELSLQSLYLGSSTFDSVYTTLSKNGFRLQYLVNPLIGKSRQILQIDGVFLRERG